jgi:hypothetical protein
MALDPTGQPTGWGLGTIGAPSVSTTPLAPRPTMQFTPEQIAQMRKDAMALQTPPAQGIHHWTQGLAELVRAIQGNREADFARSQEYLNRKADADASLGLLPPTQSPGGGSPASPSAAGAAPAGTLGSGPAGAMPSSGTPPPASTTTADTSPFAPAISGIESGGSKNPYTVTGPATKTGDKAYGKYQVMGANIPQWTQEALGKPMTAEEYLASPEAQEAVFKHKFGEYVQKYGPEGAAKAWFAGEHGMNNPNAKDSLGTTVSDYGRKFNAAAPASAAAPAPTGLLAPIAPPAAPASPPAAAAVPASPPVPANQASATPPTRLAYAGPGPIPTGMLPSAITQGGQVPAPPRSVFDTGAAPITPSPMAPLISAIAGRPAVPPPAPPPGAVPDFAKQAAILAAGRGPAVPLPPVSQPPAADFAQQLAALTADRGPSVPLSPAQGAAVMPPLAGAPPPPLAIPPVPPAATPLVAAPVAAVPPSPVPVPAPRPTVPLPTGAAIPGAVGPTSVGGTPLVPPATAALPPPVGSTSVNGAQLPQSGAPNAALVSAIAGRPTPTPVSLPVGAPNPAAPIQVAQNGLPTSAAPSPAGVPSPLIAPHPSLEQYRAVIGNINVSPALRALAFQQVQQMMQPQTKKVPGGTIEFIPGTGQQQFIPEEVSAPIKSGSTEVQGRAVYDPTTGRYHVQTLLPDAPAKSTQPGSVAQPDFSTIGGMQANELAQAEAKKGAEAAAEANAKRYGALHAGVSGGGDTAADGLYLTKIAKGAINDPRFYSGTVSNAIQDLKKAGVALNLLPQDYTTPTEVLNKVMASNILSQVDELKSQQEAMSAGGGGRIFQSQIELMQKAAQNPENSVAANRYLTALAEWSANRRIKIANMADDYAQAHGGRLDAGFNKSLRNAIVNDPDLALPKELQFAGSEGAAASRTDQTGAQPKTISTQQEYEALPSGDSYIAPDGSTRTKK